jgi:hypothetical protein
LVAGSLGVDHALRDVLDFRGIANRRATELLHD